MLKLHFRSSLGPSVSSAPLGRELVWTLCRCDLSACNKRTRIMVSRLRLTYLGRVMLSLLLWCPFNEYVVIICLGRWYLGPPLSLLRDLCCLQIPLSLVWLLHRLVDWALILCITGRRAGEFFVCIMQSCYICISVKCQPINRGWC